MCFDGWHCCVYLEKESKDGPVGWGCPLFTNRKKALLSLITMMVWALISLAMVIKQILFISEFKWVIGYTGEKQHKSSLGKSRDQKKGQSWLYVKSRGLVLSVTKHLLRPKPTQCAFWTYFSTVFQLNLAVDILYRKSFKINECSDSRIIRELPVPCSQITQVMLCKSYQCQRTYLCVLLCTASSKWTL